MRVGGLSNDSVCVCVCVFLSDDMTIKLWDWDRKWTCSQVFEGHTHYVMQVVFNPKDNNQFASGSLDRTIKVQYILRYSTCMQRTPYENTIQSIRQSHSVTK